MISLGKISYPLYLWHWVLLVFFAIVKFKDLTALERPLVVGLSIALAAATYHFVEIPFRFGRSIPLKMASLGTAMAAVGLLAVVVVGNDGLALPLPPDIRALAQVPTQAAKWRVHQCLLDLSEETSFADSCVDRDRRPFALGVGWFDRGLADAAPAQSAGKPQVRHRPVHLFVVRSCPARPTFPACPIAARSTTRS
jgi:hypothetical protein